MPHSLVTLALRPVLPLYPILRPSHARRLRACFAAAPFSLSIGGYYRCRLAGLMRGLRMHGRSIRASDCRREGWEYYRDALAGGGPVALLGLHAGPFELLHRDPESPEGKPFRILTAPAFSRRLTAFMAQGREGGGKQVLWVGSEGTRSLERGLRETANANGVLALMVDQHPGKQDAVDTLDLWGRIRVPWPARLLEFLASQGFTCIPVSARMDVDGMPVVTYHAPLRAPTREAVGAFLEAAIAAAPDQWNWSYPKIMPAEPMPRPE